MADQRKPRRPVAGSRPTPGRPRRLAGHAGRDQAEQQAPEAAAEEAAADEVVEDAAPSSTSPSSSSSANDSEVQRPGVTQREGRGRRDRGGDASADSGLLASRRTTRVLVVAGAALALLLVAEMIVFGWSTWFHEDDTQEVRGFDQPFVVAEEPVQIPLADWRAANKAAADAVTEILTVNWKDYDENLEQAAGLMTEDFLEEYSNTARDTRERFIDAKTDYKIEVVGSSVVEATEDQVAALLFLNQTVNKGEGKDRAVPQVYQVRAKVLMVRTATGWLLQELQPF